MLAAPGLALVVALWLSGLLGQSTTTMADEPAADRLVLRVGKPMLWSPGYPSVTISCDDRSLLRIEDAGEKLRLTGLRPGQTRCGFWQATGIRRVVEIAVVEG
jgi:hypothetical protein